VDADAVASSGHAHRRIEPEGQRDELVATLVHRGGLQLRFVGWREAQDTGFVHAQASCGG